MRKTKEGEREKTEAQKVYFSNDRKDDMHK